MSTTTTIPTTMTPPRNLLPNSEACQNACIFGISLGATIGVMLFVLLIGLTVWWLEWYCVRPSNKEEEEIVNIVTVESHEPQLAPN